MVLITPLQVLLFLFSIFPSSLTLKITVCNCSTSYSLGMLDTEIPKFCNNLEAPQPAVIVDYALFGKGNQGFEWDATSCSKWIESQEKTTFFFGSTDTINHKYDASVTPDECAVSARFPFLCGENKITQFGSTYKFVKAPKAESNWMRMNFGNSTCCVTQKIKLYQPSPTCPISSPFGSINVTQFNSNYAFVNGITIIWETKRHIKNCQFNEIHRGRGMLRPHATAARLIDEQYQLEYLFDYTALAAPPCPKMTKIYTQFHPVQGLEKTYLAFVEKQRLQKRDIQEVVAPAFINSTLIRPYISSFNCLTQGNDNVKLSPCLRPVKDEDSEKLNERA